MAEIERNMDSVSTTPIRSSSEDKENILIESGMKTVSKLDAFSPFLKHGSKGFKILSDDEIASNHQSKMKSNSKGKIPKRRSLATLQPPSDGKGKLVGNGRENLSIKEAFKRKKDAKHSSNATKVDVVATQIPEEVEDTTISDEELTEDQLVSEALSLMKKTENIDDSYWKKLAEERREALEETLQENEKLYDVIDILTEEKEQLKQLLGDAGCYKILYNNLLAAQKESNSASDDAS